ncbi:hypothetical protein Gohar_024997, partial [Gossypium harknessii]|nr:hypothetical protein [Gossypium harknessii]
MGQSLARLNKVELINLPQLKGRDRNDIVLTSPSLHMLRVRDCPQLTQLFEYSGYNVSSLEILSLSGLAELRVIWSGPIQVEHFQNLTQLTVRDCRRLRYIFSRTIARNLPQLRTLIILD